MATRISNLIACFLGCVVASLLGLLLMLRFDAPLLGMLTAAIIPPIAVRLSSAINPRQLAKIALYAGIGWMLGFSLQPVVAETSASHTLRILQLPLLGYDWQLHGSAVSTILALVGVYFIPRTLNVKIAADETTSGLKEKAASSAG